MNEESVARILNSQNEHKVIRKPNMNTISYVPLQNQTNPTAIRTITNSTFPSIQPPVTAGEHQRSLIKGRGQYYKNYGQMTQIDQMPGTGVYNTIDETGLTQPGTAEKMDNRTVSSKQHEHEGQRQGQNQLLNVQVHASNTNDPMKMQTKSGFSEPGMASDAISYNEQMFMQQR